MNKIIRLIIIVLITLGVCCVVLIMSSSHLDGFKRPMIIVTVIDQDRKPLADVSVMFLDSYWCHNNRWHETKIFSNPLEENKEEFLQKGFLAHTDSKGHAEVKGYFHAATYIWGVSLYQEGELLLEKEGYEPVSVKLNDRSYRNKILKGQITLDIKMDKKKI